MKEYIHHRNFLLIVFILQYFVAAELKDEKSRQTFVIRYKNGEQTIPVTVVLDYKKQTEYVINMNPRTPAKSVTLYDFKQRTIAYKDLTNKECFLGRLTHETMNHESASLHEVKNPVDSKPKILSLDPHKPALTPTEIRNIAGQKTAVFCRKMNTWLLRPLTTHKIKKRDVDEEFEERTYNRHGYHTVQYAHYGRETRKRYRNPSRTNTKNLTQIYQIPAENKNPRHSPEIPSETFNFDEIPHQPVHNNHYHAGSYGMASGKENIDDIPQIDHHTDNIPRGFGDSAHAHHFNFQMSEESSKANSHNDLPDAKNSVISNHPVNVPDRNISNSVLDSEGNVLVSMNPTANDLHSGYHVRSPHSFRDSYSSSFRKSPDGNLQENSKHFIPNFNYGRNSVNNNLNNDIKETFPAVSENVNNFLKTTSGENVDSNPTYQNSITNKVENIVSTDHDKNISNISNIPFVPNHESRGEYFGNLYSKFDNFSPTFKPETEKLKLHKSHHISHVKIDERIPNARLYQQSSTRNPNIETESLAEEELHNINGYEPQIIPQLGDIPSTTEDPDVSINVLEIPKISNKFENLDNRAKPNIDKQTNEDVHTVIEGFYDLHGNYPSSRPNHNLNSSIHQQLNGEKSRQFLIPNSHTFTKHISSHSGDYDNLKHKSNVSYPHITKLTTEKEEILYTTSSPGRERIINIKRKYFNKINDSTAPFYSNPNNYNFETNNALHPDSTKFTALSEELPYTTSSPEPKRIINAQSNYINKVKGLNATAYNNPNIHDIFQTFSHSVRNSPNKHNAFSSNVMNSNQFSFSNTLDKDRISKPNTLDIIPKPYAITEPSTTLKSVSISSRRSDLPSEHILDENNDNNASSNSEITEDNIFSKSGINNTNNLHTDLRPTLVTKDETSPRRIRFQNVLRGFKPDEIIIDIEKISTEQPPDNTFDFRHRTITNETPINRSFNNVINARDRQSEQSAGTTFRSRPIYITRAPRLRENNGMRKQAHNGITFHVRKDVLPRQQQLNNSHQQGHPRLIYNRNEASLQNQIVSAHQFNHPHQYDHQLQMNALPPGVSMHPRHPQAPYANMVHTNMIQSLPQSNPNRRSHRQRHHRKKDRFTNSCCRTSESSNTRQSCCRSGGSCCSGLRRTLLPRTSCCSSKNNHNKQVRFPYRNQKQVQNDQPRTQVTENLLDTRDRCQKEKMCRTVYESTQQVMVCRNVNIAGC